MDNTPKSFTVEQVQAHIKARMEKQGLERFDESVETMAYVMWNNGLGMYAVRLLTTVFLLSIIEAHHYCGKLWGYPETARSKCRLVSVPD